ncbi:MAG: CvpA family protein [Planctomycetota bacterium]|jgi:hypothetical protein|nr:CvpA family protein [Planctomycetota bacterium]MDP7249483.1 CvpA family protein [Planctomycetota bacterium]
MILDALIGGFLFAGLILGLKFGLKQAAGLAAAIICVQTGALAIAALLGWLMFKLFGSADYLVRTCSFFGFLILGLTLGIRSVLNKLAHGEGKPIPAAVNGLGGALFGVLAGFSGFHAAFLFAIQLPILAAPLAPQFADREDAGEAQGAILPAVINVLSKGFEPLRSSIQPNPEASVFISTIAGRIAGDYHSCLSTSYRQGEPDAVTLFMKLSVFTDFYTRQSLYKDNPWVSSAIANIQKLASENQSGLLQKSQEVFLEGSVEEMNFFLAAVSVIQSTEFARVKLEGDAVRRTVGWAEKYKKEGQAGRAIRIYQSYLKGNRSSRYRARITRDAAALGMAVATSSRKTTSPDGTVTPPRIAPPKNSSGDILQELRSFRFKAAVTMAEKLLQHPEADRDAVEQLLQDSARLQALHRKLLQQIRQVSQPLTLKVPGTEQTATVVSAFEGSVALKTGGSVKTIAWKKFPPADLLLVYEKLAANDTDGLAAFRKIFEL